MNSDEQERPVYLICADAADGENKVLARVLPSAKAMGKEYERPVEANARLIASSPELIDVVLRLKNILILNPELLAKHAETVDLMNAAVAKAMGGDE
jgi:hypothetical protein